MRVFILLLVHWYVLMMVGLVQIDVVDVLLGDRLKVELVLLFPVLFFFRNQMFIRIIPM